jgi:hypothetical protein
MEAVNANAWTSPWVTAGTNATATFSGFNLSQNATGQVKVFVQNYASSSPLIVAKGIVTPARGPVVYKMVEISGIIQRSLFAKGLVGRNGVRFSGNNASVDSWDSTTNDDGTPRASPVGYSAAVRHDKGSIAAVNITATDAVGNANIWGTASVGGSADTNITVGPNGSVGPFGTQAGQKNPNYVSGNFTANLPTPTAPTPPGTPYNLGAVSGPTTLPRAADNPSADGKYYYTVSSLSEGGNASNVFAIAANKSVVLLFSTASGADAISIGGNGSMSIGAGANLAIYTQGNISIAGNGIANNNATSVTTSLQIWGTNPTDPASNGGNPAQSITIAGNGSLAGTVYAPNASLSAKGGGNSGSIYGAFVAYSVTITGNDAFHYDENLARQGNSGSFSPTKWRELVSATERAAYASYF